MMEGVDYNSMASNRPSNDEQQQDIRRNRKADYRFLIPSRDAGGSNILICFVSRQFLESAFLCSFVLAIIGKGGKTIQDLRVKHRCQIQMADCQTPERVLIISGDQADILHCISDILTSIQANHQRSTKTDQSEIRALIHQSQAGALIGNIFLTVLLPSTMFYVCFDCRVSQAKVHQESKNSVKNVSCSIIVKYVLTKK